MPLARAAEPSQVFGPDQNPPPILARFASQGTARRIATWCEVGLGATALPFFPFLVVAPRGVVPLISVTGLCAAGLVLSTGGPKPRLPLTLAAGLFGVLLLWGMLSSLWSVDPLRSMIVAARLAGLLAIGLALAEAADHVLAPRRLNLLILVGFALGVLMAAADLATHGAVGAPFTDRAYQAAGLNRASVSFAILLLPACAVLFCRGQTICALMLALITATVIYALSGTAAKGALSAGLSAGAALYASRARVARVTALASVLIIVTAPLTFAKLAQLPVFAQTADTVKLSAGHRLFIWSFAGDRVAERALTGWGLDASRAMPGGSDPIRPGQTWMPLHPHNAPLQFWLELGGTGAVVFALLVALAWLSLAEVEWPRPFAAAAGASLTVALMASFASYGVWEEWWLSTLLFALYAILVMGRVSLVKTQPASDLYGHSSFTGGGWPSRSER